MTTPNSYRIFLIDDNYQQSAARISVLQQTYNVRMATTTNAITDKLNSFQPHLILMDYFAGVHSATALAEVESYVRQTQVPAVLFSSTPDIGLFARALGFSGFIEKTGDISALTSQIARFLETDQSSSQVE